MSQYNLSSWLNSMMLSIAFVAFDEITDAYNKSKNGSSIKSNNYALFSVLLACQESHRGAETAQHNKKYHVLWGNSIREFQ